MSKGALSLILLILLSGMVLGSTFVFPSALAVNSTGEKAPAYERHVVVCPNPDCELHDPDYEFNDYGGNGRPIDMEFDGSYNYRMYLCQICGEQWVSTGVGYNNA